MKRTCLYEKHLEAKDKLVPFAGWEMPIQYSSLKEEAMAIRKEVGMFDASHMGEFFVSGPETYKFLDYILTNDVATPSIGKAIYSPLCQQDGGILDDLIVYKIQEDKALVCVNASNIETDFEFLEKEIKNFNCQITNESDNYGLIALQGPFAEQILNKLNIGQKAVSLEYYGVTTFDDGLIARTGYTGEDGFEIFSSPNGIRNLWDELIRLGVKPCGLGARDVLRLEVCYPLYGNELNNDITPLDAGLKWTVKFKKESFLAKKALEEYRPKYKLVKLSIEKGIPRQGCDILNSSGKVIGLTTSGTFSVTLNHGIALARIKANYYPEDEVFKIKIRQNEFSAKLHKKPFVVGGHK